MEVLPLHKHKELTDACADILNTHWPRSKAARNHSLSKSCDGMPVCLAFVRQDGIKVEVIGFSKISAVQGIQNACLVESVIVRDSDRGKGLGKKLMKLTENYAQKLGVKTVYLNTLDKEGFYGKIGYVKCSPVISLGDNAHRVPEVMLKKLLATSAPSPLTDELNPNGSALESKTNDCVVLESNNRNIPPLPSKLTNNELIFSAPPPPPPPPSLTTDRGPYSRSVLRMDPNCVIWMKKDL